MALNPYRVTAKIGEGGMEVYRERDTKLDRDVVASERSSEKELTRAKTGLCRTHRRPLDGHGET